MRVFAIVGLSLLGLFGGTCAWRLRPSDTTPPWDRLAGDLAFEIGRAVAVICLFLVFLLLVKRSNRFKD